MSDEKRLAEEYVHGLYKHTDAEDSELAIPYLAFLEGWSAATADRDRLAAENARLREEAGTFYQALKQEEGNCLNPMCKVRLKWSEETKENEVKRLVPVKSQKTL